MFDDLPSDLEGLRTLQVWHERRLRRIDRKITQLAQRQAKRQASARRLRDRHHHSYQNRAPIYVEASTARLHLDVTVWHSNAPRSPCLYGTLITTD
ncbi:hypothetical protein [Streptomyces kebangsaanensis]|uniref:hypothetical protein n=1 Tax=Streptomyces kebangsaanensis TaxID=864058 RepID=UPI000939B0EF|nr:hypothetical protein [Streptomyces kebangsaanensis]